MKMNRLLPFVLSVSLFAHALGAAGYEPTTSWPYIYEQFMPGHIKTHQGGDISYDKLNVNLVSGRVHYVEDGVIMQADPGIIALLVIGGDSWMCVEGRMTKVLRNTAHSAVLLNVSIDTEAMSRADIGYGTSPLASTCGLSLTALSSGMDYSVNRSLDDVIKERSQGQPLELREVRGIYYKGRFVPASRADVLKIPGIDKDAVKQYVKAGKIKFNNVEDLAALADFLYSL